MPDISYKKEVLYYTKSNNTSCILEKGYLLKKNALIWDKEIKNPEINGQQR